MQSVVPVLVMTDSVRPSDRPTVRRTVGPPSHAGIMPKRLQLR